MTVAFRQLTHASERSAREADRSADPLFMEAVKRAVDWVLHAEQPCDAMGTTFNKEGSPRAVRKGRAGASPWESYTWNLRAAKGIRVRPRSVHTASSGALAHPFILVSQARLELPSSVL